ncbi:MAG: hypothetical protein ABI533_01470 [Betaproteobacteria bacterium]
MAGLIELRAGPVEAAARAGVQPEAFAAARWINRDHEVIPNLYHEPLRRHDPVGRKLLALLDGTRSREAPGHALPKPFGGERVRARLVAAPGILAAKALLVR